MNTAPSNSVYYAFQTAARDAVSALSLTRVNRNVSMCDSPFSEIDMRSGAYVTPEGRKVGQKPTNEKDHIGYVFQITVIEGRGSVGSSDTSVWQQAMQELATAFNNKRPTVPELPDTVTLLPAEAGEYSLPNDDKFKGFHVAAVRVTFWCRQPRDLTP